jgi:putative acetyltransferase
VRIRPAREADVAALARVAAASYRAAFQVILGEEGLAQREEPFFVARFGSEWSTLRLAEKDGRILGFHQVREGRLDMLFLAPEVIGQGLGASLLADAEERGAIALECFRDNQAARRFYERHGWRFEQALEREFAGAVRAFVTYRKGG